MAVLSCQKGINNNNLAYAAKQLVFAQQLLASHRTLLTRTEFTITSLGRELQHNGIIKPKKIS
jgi:hypothetical protein